MKMLTVFLLLAIFLCVPAFSAEKITIAVMDLDARGLQESEAEKISLILRNELSNSREFQVLDRNRSAAGAPACSDLACAVQAGKQLGARKILIGSLLKLGEQLTVICRIIDVEKGAVDFAENERALFQSDELYMVQRLCDKVTRRITGKPLYTGEEKPDANKSKKNHYQGYYETYRPVKDPICWLAVGSGVASAWGFFMAHNSYEWRTRYSYLEKFNNFFTLMMVSSFSMSPYTQSMLTYTLLNQYENRRSNHRRAVQLRERNYYISAGFGGFSALMFITFIGRNIAHAVTESTNEKAGDVSLVLPTSYEESAGRAGREQFNIGLGLSMKF